LAILGHFWPFLAIFGHSWPFLTMSVLATTGKLSRMAKNGQEWPKNPEILHDLNNVINTSFK